MKTCFCCKQEKELSEFYKHPMMSDGHLNKCKDCIRAYTNSRRREMPEHVREIDRKRSMNPDRKKNLRLRAKEHRKLHPEKAHARRVAAYNVRVGKWTRQPCERCGEQKAQIHHPDYSKPLEIMWLCFTCHRREHGALVT